MPARIPVALAVIALLALAVVSIKLAALLAVCIGIVVALHVTADDPARDRA